MQRKEIFSVLLRWRTEKIFQPFWFCELRLLVDNAVAKISMCLPTLTKYLFKCVGVCAQNGDRNAKLPLGPIHSCYPSKLAIFAVASATQWINMEISWRNLIKKHDPDHQNSCSWVSEAYCSQLHIISQQSAPGKLKCEVKFEMVCATILKRINLLGHFERI